MQVFHFKANDKSGHVLEGEIASMSLKNAQAEIEKQGYELITVKPKGKWFDFLLAYTITVRDRSIFYKQLATMLKAGLPITQAIDISRQNPKAYFSRLMGEISLGLENGYPLSRCMDNYPKIFPEVERGVLRAGEATGKMDTVLKEIADQAARIAGFRSKVRNAMYYPGFIIVVMIGVGVIIMTRIIPPIKEIFEESNVSLPWTTNLLIWISDFLIHKWWLAIVIIVALIGLIKLFGSFPFGKRIYSSIRLNFPIFGALTQETFLATFNRTFSMLLKAGVPIIESVNIASKLTDNIIYIQILDKLSQSLEKGAPITTMLQSNRYFPTMMTQMLNVGQQTGDLSGMCSTMADFYEEQVEAKLKTFSALIEPMIIVVIGAAVGFVVVSILMPIYQLANVI